MMSIPVADSEHFGVLVHGDVAKGAILVPCYLVMNHSMPVTEGSSLNVLTTQSHVIPFDQQRRKSQCLRTSPVDAFPCFDHLCPRFVYLLHCSVRRQLFRYACDAFPHCFQDLWIHPAPKTQPNINYLKAVLIKQNQFHRFLTYPVLRIRESCSGDLKPDQ